MYDCDLCRRKGYQKERTCYIEEEQYDLSVPIFGDDDEENASKASDLVYPEAFEVKRLNKDELLDYVFEFHERNPNFHPAEVILRIIDTQPENKEVCMTAFADPFSVMLI